MCTLPCVAPFKHSFISEIEVDKKQVMYDLQDGNVDMPFSSIGLPIEDAELARVTKGSEFKFHGERKSPNGFTTGNSIDSCPARSTGICLKRPLLIA